MQIIKKKIKQRRTCSWDLFSFHFHFHSFSDSFFFFCLWGSFIFIKVLNDDAFALVLLLFLQSTLSFSSCTDEKSLQKFSKKTRRSINVIDFFCCSLMNKDIPLNLSSRPSCLLSEFPAFFFSCFTCLVFFTIIFVHRKQLHGKKHA